MRSLYLNTGDKSTEECKCVGLYETNLLSVTANDGFRGFVAFEVGEVRHGSIRFEISVQHAMRSSGLQPELILITEQEFTKTANCWGVDDNGRGTNSNQIVVARN